MSSAAYGNSGTPFLSFEESSVFSPFPFFGNVGDAIAREWLNRVRIVLTGFLGVTERVWLPGSGEAWIHMQSAIQLVAWRYR